MATDSRRRPGAARRPIVAGRPLRRPRPRAPGEPRAGRARLPLLPRALRRGLRRHLLAARADRGRAAAAPRPRGLRGADRRGEAPRLRRGPGLPAARLAGAALPGAGSRGARARGARGPDRPRPAEDPRGAGDLAAPHRVGHEDRHALPRVRRGGPLRLPARARLPAGLPAGVRTARGPRPAPRRRRLHEAAPAKA